MILMRPENEPVKCRWPAEELNDKSISFVPTRNGLGAPVLGQMLAVNVPGGVYIEICVTRPNVPRLIHWVSQAEADRIEKSPHAPPDFVIS